ncbi:MAG TPA: hypothetical protein VMF06_16515 [Candidatus Limnocylindria bacterium]|nr:hypothetical protein [Candidatus Limnocylindria bacterium]
MADTIGTGGGCTASATGWGAGVGVGTGLSRHAGRRGGSNASPGRFSNRLSILDNRIVNPV